MLISGANILILVILVIGRNNWYLHIKYLHCLFDSRKR